MESEWSTVSRSSTYKSARSRSGGRERGKMQSDLKVNSRWNRSVSVLESSGTRTGIGTGTCCRVVSQQGFIPSVYIPHLQNDVTRNHITSVFNKLDVGSVNSVVFMSNGVTKKAYIYFNEWLDTKLGRFIKARIMDGKWVKIVHSMNDPIYWKCYLNKTKRQYVPQS